jgi:hypothetical protein
VFGICLCSGRAEKAGSLASIPIFSCCLPGIVSLAGVSPTYFDSLSLGLGFLFVLRSRVIVPSAHGLYL